MTLGNGIDYKVGDIIKFNVGDVILLEDKSYRTRITIMRITHVDPNRLGCVYDYDILWDSEVIVKEMLHTECIEQYSRLLKNEELESWLLKIL